jgi:hypothetical protein
MLLSLVCRIVVCTSLSFASEVFTQDRENSVKNKFDPLTKRKHFFPDLIHGTKVSICARPPGRRFTVPGSAGIKYIDKS